MIKTTSDVSGFLPRFAIALSLLAALTACSQSAQPVFKKIPEGQEFSGFLKDYSGLKAVPDSGGETLRYINPDKMKNLRRYIAIIVDPVDVYISSDADEALVPKRAPEVLAAYFRRSLIHAVGDAFPVVEEPGPLVLRLRSALVGIDVGGEVAAGDFPAEAGEVLPRAVTLGAVGVEVELVDSETGERVAAAVDRAALGEGAEVGAEMFSRLERFQLAKEALDGWADRIREFMDSAVELTGEDAELADRNYQPYVNQ